LNSVVVSALIVALGVGAFATVRAIGPSKSHVIEPLTSTSPPALTSPPACTASQLRASASFNGAAGSREGFIVIENDAADACTLEGAAHVSLFDAAGNEITSGVDFQSATAQWQANGSPTPAAWPVVTVKGRSAIALVRIRWSNWCPQGGAIPTWRIAIPDSSTIDVTGIGPNEVPPCNGPGTPSTIDVGPFEQGPVS
jgi:hypothetical protein